MSASNAPPPAAAPPAMSKTARKKEKDRLKKIKLQEDAALASPTPVVPAPNNTALDPAPAAAPVTEQLPVVVAGGSAVLEAPEMAVNQAAVQEPVRASEEQNNKAPKKEEVVSSSAAAPSAVSAPVIAALPAAIPMPALASLAPVAAQIPVESTPIPAAPEAADPPPAVTAPPTAPAIISPPTSVPAPTPMAGAEPVVAETRTALPTNAPVLAPQTAPTPVPAVLSKPRASSPARQQLKKTSKPKSKSGFASLFACCFGSSSSLEEEKPLRKASPAPGTTTSSNEDEKKPSVEAPVAPATASAQLEQQTADKEAAEAALVQEKLVPTTTTTPTPVAPVAREATPLVVVADEPLPPLSASPFAAAASASAEGQAAAQAGNKRRRKSNKLRGAALVDQNIITSVPEPGQQQQRNARYEDEEYDSEDGSELDEDDEEDEEDEEMMLIARGGVGIPIGPDGQPQPLLQEIGPNSHLRGRKCLVLDLDETLVHSSFKMIHQADYVVPVEIENQYHNVYVIKRPGVDGFLKAMGEIYEIVIFTASLSKYADPVLDQLDIHRVVGEGARLFRESCYNNKGNYVKDLSQLGRPIAECIIIDNSPASYVFHPNNAVPISSWFNDPHDTELTDLIPFLTDLSRVDDVRGVLDAGLYQQLLAQADNSEELQNLVL